jgi:hypothetical protein
MAVVSALILGSLISCGPSLTASPARPNAPSINTVSTAADPGSVISPSYFGIHINHQTTPWPTFSTFGALRSLGGQIKWADIEVCDGGSDPTSPCYQWTKFDYETNLALSNGADVLFTTYATPSWASSRGGRCIAAGNPDPGCTGPADRACAFQSQNGPGICDPPDDIDAIPGSGLADGSNQHFRDFITALLAHAGPGVIKYWEVWTEPNINSEWNNAVGTQAQLIRIAQDLRQIVQAADPGAMFTTPAVANALYGGLVNWLKPYLEEGGGDLADVIAFHGYIQTGQCPASCPIPERELDLVNRLRTVMQDTGQVGKPIFDTENSWGERSQTIDWYTRVSFVGRMYLVSMSQGVDRLYWYGLDFPINPAIGGSGEFWAPDGNPDGCDAPADGGGNVCPAGIAVQQVYQWTVGASFDQPCAGVGTTWTCALSRPGGYYALAVWDSSGGPADFAVPDGYVQYRMLDGSLMSIDPSNPTISITDTPILLENQNP